jgi:H+/Cl- antiporter ClcA
MSQTINGMVADSLTAGTTSFVTAAAIVPEPTQLHTIYIPLITGILAPLVKEIIISLRESRKRRQERKAEQNNK